MEKKANLTIDLATVIAPIIGSRDLINNLEKQVVASSTKSVDLDFGAVTFISRSAAHAFLKLQEDCKRPKLLRSAKEVNFVNTNKDVFEMLRIVAANKALPKEKKPEFVAETVGIESLLEKFAN